MTKLFARRPGPAPKPAAEKVASLIRVWVLAMLLTAWTG